MVKVNHCKKCGNYWKEVNHRRDMYVENKPITPIKLKVMKNVTIINQPYCYKCYEEKSIITSKLPIAF